MLRLVSIADIAWSLLLCHRIKFCQLGRSRSHGSFSLRWYLHDTASVARDESLRLALAQSLRLAFLTMLVATPLGVALAIGLARWRGRAARAGNFLMLVPLVTPEIVMGVALFLVFANLYDFVPFGTWAQVLGHVTFSISFVVIIVRGRLFAIGRDYEEAAMDLGASQRGRCGGPAPLLSPAIFRLAQSWSQSIEDFVISHSYRRSRSATLR